MKIRSGHIPFDIIYIFAGTKKLSMHWNEADQYKDELIYTEVTPSFVADAYNDKNIKTGEDWAEKECVQWDMASRQATVIAKVQKLSLENKPISNLKVIGLESRTEGGQIYKIVTPDGFCFDIHGDVLFDAMLSVGVGTGGVLGGSYIWAKVNGDMKLVRVGSDLFVALLEAGERGFLSPIPKNKIEVGGIYESKQGARGVFLGFVTTESWKLNWPANKRPWNHYMGSEDKPTLSSKILTRQMLWFDVPYWALITHKTDPTSNMFQIAMAKPVATNGFKLKGSHSMIKTISKLKVPDDVIELVRQKALTSHETNLSQLSSKDNYRAELVTADASSVCLMRKSGAPRPVVINEHFQSIEKFINKKLP